MKINTTVTKEVSEIVEIEIDTPAWFKTNGHLGKKLYQVNSEEDMIEVDLAVNNAEVSRGPMRYIYKPERIFEGEPITEAEFTQGMAEAISRITSAAGIVSSLTPGLAIAV